MSAPAVVPALQQLEVEMPAPAALQRATALGVKAAAALGFLAPLLTRLVLGKAFYDNGSGKLENFDRTVGFFSDLGIPFPELNAAFVSRLEYYGGMLLVLGLLTRLVSLGLSCTMVVALLTADRSNLIKALSAASEVGIMDVTPIPFLIPLLWLVLFGPGPLSLDRFLTKWLGVKAAKEDEATSG